MSRGPSLVPFLVCAAALGTLPACTLMREVALVPQSHFTPPNSNVEPIGAVVGEASGGGFSPNYSAELVERAYLAALAQKNGDVLIDARLMRKHTLVLFWYSTTVRVEGTAARILAGQQKLGALHDQQINELIRSGALGSGAQAEDGARQ